MKLQILAALALAAIVTSPKADAQTTYSVIKATVSIPIFYQAADFATLLKYNMTTKAMINIARDMAVETPVPKNLVLGFAGDFNAFGQHDPNPSGPAQLVLFDTDTQQKVKTIAIGSSRTVYENEVFNRFKRVATATLTFQDTGGTGIGKFTSGVLQVGGTLTRLPNSLNPATPATLKVNSTSTVVGTVNLTFTQNRRLPGGGIGGGTATFVVPKGTIRATGKIIGTFTE